MNHLELKQTSINNYSLGADYCRSLFAKGGVCIFVQEKFKFTNIDLTKYCQDRDIEICAIMIHLNARKICIITIYRSPSGNFDIFMNKLDLILNKLFKVTVDFVICGDFNINVLVDSERKRQLVALLQTYNLTSVVKFPTRVQHGSVTSIDNFFIDITKAGNYSIKPIINGLSDHDAQVVIFHSFNFRPSIKKSIMMRKITDLAVNDFLLKLSHEAWDTVFSTDNVNGMFNSFLDTYLKIFYCSFPLKSVCANNKNNKNWITLGITTSCKRKRELYIACRDGNNPDLKNYYNKYCKILSAVIKESKKLNYTYKINKSLNKNKTMWDIIKFETNRTSSADKAITLNIDGISITNQHVIANEFNKYFLSIAKNINIKLTI
ncbi:hypothetical protein B7P43_G10883 [Cryptotermes secundus]|uniref:Endonuclease/exonuclease/phosphatase domain-containing protein n=1 Tax=Cryptotermes secundus TaxID=105785 RepID=A0A2J7QPG9_9NEOP|nr:hypothetical protein B7P43_G10883 [Cryptotermes secundus]